MCCPRRATRPVLSSRSLLSSLHLGLCLSWSAHSLSYHSHHAALTHQHGSCSLRSRAGSLSTQDSGVCRTELSAQSSGCMGEYGRSMTWTASLFFLSGREGETKDAAPSSGGGENLRVPPELHRVPLLSRRPEFSCGHRL